jgi:hypothetical protein
MKETKKEQMKQFDLVDVIKRRRQRFISLVEVTIIRKGNLPNQIDKEF